MNNVIHMAAGAPRSRSPVGYTNLFILLVVLALVAPAPLEAAGTISGTVTQSGTATPIAGATVEVLQGGAQVTSASSGGDGVYTVGGLQAGSYALICSSSGYKIEIRSPVQASDQATTTEDFSLPPLPATGRSVKEYVYLDGKLLAFEQGPIPGVDFEEFTVSNTGDVALPPLTVGIATFSGGQVFPSSGDPENQTPVYGTRNQGPCLGCASTITITFDQPVSNVTFLLTTGFFSGYESYFLADNVGGSSSVSFYNGDPPTQFVGAPFPNCNISQLTITSNTGPNWAFWIDKLSYALTAELGEWCPPAP